MVGRSDADRFNFMRIVQAGCHIAHEARIVAIGEPRRLGTDRGERVVRLSISALA